MTHRRWKIVARLVTIPLVVGGVVLIARQLDGPTVMAALRGASWPLVACALGFIVIGSGAQVVRTQQFLLPAKHIPLRRIVRYQLAAGAATNLLPARAGEALRAYLLRVNEGVPVATTAGLVVGEYAVKAVTLLALAAPIPWIMPLERIGLTSSRVAWSGAALAIVAMILIAVYRWGARGDAPRWLRDLVTSLRALARGRQLVAILALTTLAWLCEAVATILVARALGHSLSLTGALLVLVTLNVALSVPSTPGRVGVFELGAVFGLGLLGIPEADAVLIALLCHLIQFLPTTLFGLAGLPLALTARKEAASP